MKRYRFWQLDVFTARPFGGNQLAVFPDARGLTSQEMQILTREMNYSESTFVLPPEIPGALKKVRIFTPAIEMPMAGHPTVGTAAVLAARGEIAVPAEGGEVILELGIGAVPVIFEPRMGGGLPFVWMKHRAPEYGEVRADRDRVARALGILPDAIRTDLPLQVVSTGVPFLFVPLRGLTGMREVRSEAAALAQLFEGITMAHVALVSEETVDPQARIHARMFSPHLAGIVEDPATGSMAAPLGAYLAHYGLLGTGPVSPFEIEQGLEMQRPSRIHVEVGHLGSAVETIRIGGESVLVGEGEIAWA
jgi:trans-2,3-dihydro-3-hydroxyanthranilate isomerase